MTPAIMARPPIVIIFFTPFLIFIMVNTKLPTIMTKVAEANLPHPHLPERKTHKRKSLNRKRFFKSPIKFFKNLEAQQEELIWNRKKIRNLEKEISNLRRWGFTMDQENRIQKTALKKEKDKFQILKADELESIHDREMDNLALNDDFEIRKSNMFYILDQLKNQMEEATKEVKKLSYD